jgi:antitoxin HicB
MDYPVKLERDDNDTILVSFPDFPEAHTFGDNVEDALMRAPDALATAIDGYIKDRRDIPSPSAIAAMHRVAVPALLEAKIRLYEVMREAKIGKSELARRLDWHSPQVDRLLAMAHGSKLEQLESAFLAMGKRLVIRVEDITPARHLEKSTSRGRGRKESVERERRKASASPSHHAAAPDRSRGKKR